jgi:hypothetical protein
MSVTRRYKGLHIYEIPQHIFLHSRILKFGVAIRNFVPKILKGGAGGFQHLRAALLASW